MTNHQTRGTTRETAISEQGASLAESLRLDVGSRIQHFLHTRPPLWTFVTNDDDVAGMHCVAQNGGDGSVLAFEYTRLAGELQDAFIHAGGLDDATLLGNIAVQDCQTTILRIRVFAVTDATVAAIQIILFIALGLRKRHLSRDTARRSTEQLVYGSVAAD